MNKAVLLKDGRSIKVISAENVGAELTEAEIEMDYRAREAVKAAINKAKACKKPIAKYDSVYRKAYLQTADGEKIFIK